MYHEIMTDAQRNAVQIIIEEKTAYHDPEDADGNLPDLAKRSRALLGTPPPPKDVPGSRTVKKAKERRRRSDETPNSRRDGLCSSVRSSQTELQWDVDTG
jgi:hypothetical protein